MNGNAIRSCITPVGKVSGAEVTTLEGLGTSEHPHPIQKAFIEEQCVLYEGENGYSAMVVDVEVDQDTGAVALKRTVVSADCGPISNPDGLKNQIEGGALQGASRAILEEATWDERKVTSIDWRTHGTWFLGSTIPTIETVLINRPDEEANGAGETSITIVAAAIGNAIFDATGVRLRRVPFTTERVKAALEARPAPA